MLYCIHPFSILSHFMQLKNRNSLYRTCCILFGSYRYQPLYQTHSGCFFISTIWYDIVKHKGSYVFWIEYHFFRISISGRNSAIKCCKDCCSEIKIQETCGGSVKHQLCIVFKHSIIIKNIQKLFTQLICNYFRLLLQTKPMSIT